MLRVETYNGQKSANFFIQCKGNYSGRPLRKPIPNCFAVFTKNPLAFEIVYCLFKAKIFEYYIIGSVIPFIRITEVKKILEKYIQVEFCEKKLKAIQGIDELLTIKQEQIKKLMDLQTAFALESIKSVK